jgi:hypothetical protein
VAIQLAENELLLTITTDDDTKTDAAPITVRVRCG